MAKPNDYDLLPALTARKRAIRARYRHRGYACWLWTGACTRNGYGTYSLQVDGRGRSVRAHRAVFMLTRGRPIAEGLELHHMCGVARCVNPDHMLELTHEENAHRLRRGLTPEGLIAMGPFRRG